MKKLPSLPNFDEINRSHPKESLEDIELFIPPIPEEALVFLKDDKKEIEAKKESLKIPANTPKKVVAESQEKNPAIKIEKKAKNFNKILVILLLITASAMGSTIWYYKHLADKNYKLYKDIDDKVLNLTKTIGDLSHENVFLKEDIKKYKKEAETLKTLPENAEKDPEPLVEESPPIKQ